MDTVDGSASTLRQFCALAAIVLAGILALIPSLHAQPTARSAHIFEIDGAIGPATAAYISRGLEKAKNDRAQLVIIAVDTPGGLDTSMREIIQDILAMPVPVVTWVHPSGARAASAGTYILYASHFAAMTPGTNLGAATPIQIGVADPSQNDGNETEQPGASRPKNAGERKAVNDAVAYIRSLAEMRGRNADWAESAVRSAESLSAEAALEQGVIDIVAEDLETLLQQLQGRKVTIDSVERIVDTSDLALKEIEPDWSDRLLATITNPNIALILMMIGIYGLFFEFMNPGALVPGTIGGISLLIGLYALAALPVDFVGVALIVLGLGLMVAEAFSPSFGILGLGGLVAFLFGATIMFDTDIPAFQVNWSVLAAVAVFTLGLIVAIGRLAFTAHRSRVETGSEQMVGATGAVLDWNEGRGHILVHGERWNANGPEILDPAANVVVRGIDGLTLTVAPPGEHDREQTGD